MLPRNARLALAAAGLALGAVAVPPARAEEPITIAKLLKDGWTIAGYTATNNAYILFRHENADHLVQCSVLYDTTRGATNAERVKTNCYELH